MFCGKHNIFNAVALKDTRLKQKSNVIVKKWEEHQKAPFYKKALKIHLKQMEVHYLYGEVIVNKGHFLGAGFIIKLFRVTIFWSS